MRRGTAIGLVVTLFLNVAVRADVKAPVAKIELEDGDALVFLGDSITHQCLYTQYVEDYFYTRYPGKRIHFHNSGVGGDRNADALIRFDQDVAKYKPKYVTILLGMNDGSYQSFNQEIFDRYETDMVTLLDRIKEIGATAVLMTPTMFDARAARARGKGQENRNVYYNSTLAYYGMRLQEFAMGRGLGFVNMFAPLNQITVEQRKTDPSFTLIRDAVHPGADGQVVMAAALLNDMHPNRVVSTIHVTIGPEGYPKVRGVNGKAAGIDSDSARVALEFTADSLPWVLPEDASLGYKLTKAGHRLSREQFRVNGLRTGRYKLTIDGKQVGVFSDVQLARGVELQSNAKTPQYQQAAKVAELNRKRNDEAYRPIRNLWRDKKIQRFAEMRVKQNPNDEGAKKRLDQINAKLQSFETDLKALQDKARQIEEEIYKVNQPQPRKYALKRVQEKK